MDVEDFGVSSKWDEERLGSLAAPLNTRGGEIAQTVLQGNSGLVCCQSENVKYLATYLNYRGLLNQNEFEELSQHGNGHGLSRILFKASGEPSRRTHLISGLYLALLDMYLCDCDSWCHYAAFNIIWESAVQQLNLPEHSLTKKIDFAQVVRDAPQVDLPSPTAGQLRRNLNPHLGHCTEEITNLRKILEEFQTGDMGLKSESPLGDVVMAMMKTCGVGRHVSKLLPFYRSYPVEVLQFLKRLGHRWKEFAIFIGFSEGDIDLLSVGDTNTQLKNLSKVWRMPDLKHRKNNEVLDEVLKIAGITLDVNAPLQEEVGNAKSITTVNHYHGPVTISTNSPPLSQANPHPTAMQGDGSRVNGRHRNLGEIRGLQGSSSDRESEVDHITNQQSSFSDDDDTVSLASLPNFQGQSSVKDDPDSEPTSAHHTEGSHVGEVLLQDQNVNRSVDTKKQFPNSMSPSVHQQQSTEYSPSQFQPLTEKLINTTSQSHDMVHPNSKSHLLNTSQQQQPIVRPPLQLKSPNKLINTSQQLRVRSTSPPIKSHANSHDFNNTTHHSMVHPQLKPISLPYINSTQQQPVTMHPLGKSRSLPHEIKSTPQQSQFMRPPLKSHSLTQEPHNTTQQPRSPKCDSNKKSKSPIIKPPLDLCPLSLPLPQFEKSSLQPARHHDEVIITSSIGSGLYGEMFAVLRSGKEGKYAAKEYRNISREKLERIFTEKLHSLDHQNVVTYLGVCQLLSNTPPALPVEIRPAMLMERFATNLETFLKTPALRPMKKLEILSGIADGLGYLHQQDIIHCDLTAHNVLLTDRGTPKIADCCNSFVKFIGDMEGRIEDTHLDYLPPEAVCSDSHSSYTYSTSLDVFSFGHLSIYVVIQHEPHPLKGYTDKLTGKPRTEVKRREKYITEARELYQNKHLLDPLFEFIVQCLSDTAVNRPPITDFRLIL